MAYSDSGFSRTCAASSSKVISMPGIETSRNEFRFRVKSPRKFDKRSFRRTDIGKKHLRGKSCATLIVGCPKGHWHPRSRKGKQCDVGLQTQAVRFNKDCYDKDDVKIWIRRNICVKQPGLCKGVVPLRAR